MRVIARFICLAVILYIGAMAPGAASEKWTLVHDIALPSKSPDGRGLKDETVTADLGTRRLKAGTYRYTLRLVHPVNPAPPTIRVGPRFRLP